MPSSLHRNNISHERRAWRTLGPSKSMDRAISYSRSINKTNDLNLSKSSISQTPSNVVHRMTRKKAELRIIERRPHLRLCFSVCGSPRRSEIGKLRRAHLWKYDSNASVPAEVKITSSCNLQKGADWGRQRGNLGVLGYPTVLEREKKWPALLGYLLEFP